MKLIKESDGKIHWTSHSKSKMRYYGLSEQRVLKILRKPERKEEGIAQKTIAAMQISGTKKNPTEVWMMYQVRKAEKFKQIRIISAWRYPGRTPAGSRPTIPEDTLEILEKLN